MTYFAARQVGRQGLPLGLLTLARGGRGRGESFDLFGDRLQIRVQRLFQQASLLGVEALRLRGKLQPLQDRVLVRELLDQRVLVLYLGEQARRELAQLRGIHGVDVLLGDHGV